MKFCDVIREWWEVSGAHAERRDAYGDQVILGVAHHLKMGTLET